ncbi:MAG: 8-amino-7-oxononanoate synthase [Planctomycetota bacterium]|nr:MAG: 8-amino-7-oxononanoate synthase [Planctomycetota bacterium]REJ94037.1 MAG: 8-amino-7-oxononanoate synthase [Planctomycetota bacterium]REK17864.1 MAG: 8-amino-7-oxononanoate synthase [Planctomycetota bacterium]REK42405.1 MAG: 8-amino-7-oxononanoate synthase [Planctomycetota bacterium]
MSSPSQALAWLDDALAELDLQQLRRQLRTRYGAQGATIDVDGLDVDGRDVDGRRLINFASNDYLALADEPVVRRAALQVLEREGVGSGASPLIVGRSEAHARLETALAEFEGSEAALLFPSGFAANSGTIPALAGPGDAIFSDAKNHASLVDGCRLSRAEVHIYRHGDVDHLRELLAGSSTARRRLIVTDSLFSMDGDLAPLTQLADLAEQCDAMLLVDEAHATGVFGRQGRGVAEHLGVEDRVDVKVGTLSKALGVAGGFVAGSQALVAWLANRDRPYVFSTAAPPAMAAAALAALRIVEEQPQRRCELLEAAANLRTHLFEQGWQIGKSESQIVPIYLGEADAALAAAAHLAERGFLVPAIRPPSVPPGEALLRLSLRWDHTSEMLAELVEAFRELQVVAR